MLPIYIFLILEELCKILPVEIGVRNQPVKDISWSHHLPEILKNALPGVEEYLLHLAFDLELFVLLVEIFDLKVLNLMHVLEAQGNMDPHKEEQIVAQYDVMSKKDKAQELLIGCVGKEPTQAKAVFQVNQEA